MSSNKRYYWLKLNENFFDREEIKVIENMPNGKDYIIFYMKLLLKSIKSEGRLLFRDVIPYTPDMLSAITGTDIDTVKVSIDLFAKLGLMEIWDDGTLFMAETQNMIGSETDSARRMRRMRAKEKQKELLPSQCDKDVKESDTDIEIDIEIEKDIDKDTTKETHTPYETIKDLYNSICKDLSKVRSISSSRKRHLKARWKQFEYSLDTFEECFKKVQVSDFCKGKNERGWQADFDWLIKNDNNMVKVLEGKYDNKNGGNSNGGNLKQDDDIYAGIGLSHEELQEL